MSDLVRRLVLPPDPREGAPLVVLMHGRGADEHDLAGLARHLPAGALAVFPRAPFSGLPWGYGPGWAWYRFLEGTRPEPESFTRGQLALDAFLEALPATLPVSPGPLVLGGFSQGGTSAIAWAVRHPGRVAAVLNFSGFVATHPEVRVMAETVGTTGFFWGHGTEDASVPFARAVTGRAALRAAGAALEARDYRAGHTITPDELGDAMTWLASVLEAG